MTGNDTGRVYWLKRFDELKMPAISAVLHEFEAITDNKDMSTVQQMADVIMKDASLTASLLKAANTVYYNPGRSQINTVSRAIVLLGVKAVKMLCVSVIVIEQLMGSEPSERLYYCLALSFHAALQAKNISAFVDPKKQEEVFIAALLFNLGELCFWALQDRVSQQLYQKLIHGNGDPERIVQEQLGVSFAGLTEGIVQNWGLSDLLKQTFSTSTGRGGGLTRSIVLGNEISRAAMEGWGNPKIAKLVTEIAKLTGEDEEAVEVQLLKSAEESQSVVGSFGVDKLADLIPVPDEQSIREKLQEGCIKLLEPSLQGYQKSLERMVAMQGSKLDLNALADSMLTAFHEGLGIERIGVYLQLSEGKPLSRYFSRIADRGEDLPDVLESQDDLFSYVINYKETLWLGIPGSVGLRDLYDSPQAREITGGEICFCGALYSSRRVIGIVYGDNRASGYSLDAMQFKGFQRVLRQANRCLSI